MRKNADDCGATDAAFVHCGFTALLARLEDQELEEFDGQ
jgi:hypothetical protein